MLRTLRCVFVLAFAFSTPGIGQTCSQNSIAHFMTMRHDIGPAENACRYYMMVKNKNPADACRRCRDFLTRVDKIEAFVRKNPACAQHWSWVFRTAKYLREKARPILAKCG